MSHPEKKHASFRLDFICNKDSFNDLSTGSTTSSQPLSLIYADFNSSRVDSTPLPSISYQSTSGINYPSNFSESSTNTCFCCGSVHYTYSNNFDNQGLHCSENQNKQIVCSEPSILSTPPIFSSQLTYASIIPTELSDKSELLNSGTLSTDQFLNHNNINSETHPSENSLTYSSYQKPSFSNNPPQNALRLVQDDNSSPKSDISVSSNEKDEGIRCLWATCSAEFTTADDLIPHLSNSHLSGRERDSKCKWEYCQDYQGGTDELLKHLNDVHLGLEQVKLTCQWEDCHSQYTSFEDLTEHLSEKHVGSGRSFYVCGWSRCQRDGRPFVQRQKVMRHLQSHTGDKPYMCMVCEKRFAQSTVMSQHLRTHTGEKPYKCPVSECGKKFSIPGSLTGHLRSHKGEKPYSCKYSGCDRQFGNSSNLSKHVRTHTGERPFRCYNNPPCPKRFARPDQAARHMKVHINDRSQQQSQPSGSRSGSRT